MNENVELGNAVLEFLRSRDNLGRHVHVAGWNEYLLGSLVEDHGRTSGAKGLANGEVGGVGHSTMSPLCCGPAWSRLETLRRSVSFYFQLSRFQFSLFVFSVSATAVSL